MAVKKAVVPKVLDPWEDKLPETGAEIKQYIDRQVRIAFLAGRTAERERKQLEERASTPDKLVSQMRNNIRSKFAEAFAEQDSIMDSNQLRRDLTKELINERRTILMRMLGLTEKYGHLEIDQHGGNKVFSDRITKEVAAVLDEWIVGSLRIDCKKHLDELFNNAKTRKTYTQRYMEQLRWKTERALENLAVKDAEILAARLVAELRGELSMAAGS